MFKNATFDRVKTYFFGVAIGCSLVTLILIAKVNMASRQLATEEAAAQAAQAARASAPPPASADPH